MCDTFVSLTDDGIIFAKNSDREPNEGQTLRWFAERDHPPGSEVECTWISIPQVDRTSAVVVSQPWWMWGAEMGANSAGVAIGNEAVYTTEPHGENALLGMDLVRLALERSSTADEAVDVIVGLLERHGQGGPCSAVRSGYTYHNSFMIADASGASVLETAGTHWAVERVEGRGRSISNGLTIEGFASRFADRERDRAVACSLRRARTEASAENAQSITDAFAALRDHGGDDHGRGGRESPEWSRRSGALSGPCAHAGGEVTSTQTTGSWVSDLRGDPLHWATTTSSPCTAVFHPVRVEDPVDLDPSLSNRFDPTTRWWSHELLHRCALRDLPTAVDLLADERDAMETAWVTAPPSTADALAESEQAEGRWAAAIRDAALDDRRPDWLRRAWNGYDHAAGMPGSLSP